MFIDAHKIEEGTVIETEVCVIGAGAAGITMARELKGQPFRVCLLESGHFNVEEDTQTLYRGENIGLHYAALDDTRSRNFGGSTHYWGGFCRPLEERDFSYRSWVPNSGWPFTRAELNPYYERAHEVCQLKTLEYDPLYWERRIGNPELRILPFDGKRVTTTIAQYSPPTQFGKVYRQDFLQPSNVSIYLHANVIDLEVTESAQEVRRVRVSSLKGNSFWVSAKLFVLAMGGIEIPRLLLASNKVQPAGLGNQHDLVGRYFMEHPRLPTGTIELTKPHTFSDLYDVTYTYFKSPIAAHLSLTESCQRDNGLLNSLVRIAAIFPGDESEGVESLRRLYWRVIKGKGPNPFVYKHPDPGTWKNMCNILKDSPSVASSVFCRYFRPQSWVQKHELIAIIEPVPTPDSRVTLSQERDPLGLPRVQLDWRLDPLVKRTIIRTHEILREELERLGFGTLQTSITDDDTWPSTLMGCSHHMGTTRMHQDPKRGVVDANCRVHGTANLFIVGSAVFPTVGRDTPTLTIVALALRLADQIKIQLANA